MDIFTPPDRENYAASTAICGFPWPRQSDRSRCAHRCPGRRRERITYLPRTTIKASDHCRTVSIELPDGVRNKEMLPLDRPPDRWNAAKHPTLMRVNHSRQ